MNVIIVASRPVTAFDLAKTETVVRLLAVPAEARDDAWVASFYAAAPDASMASGEPQVVHGPDGFPYFMLTVPPVGEGFSAFSVNHVLDLCTERGHGCVLSGDGGAPWVFTYGNLWSLRAFGSFDTRPPGAVRREPPPGAPLLTASPSDELVPPWARAVLRSWLAFVGVADPGVVLVVDGEGYGTAPADWLSFSVFPDQFDDPARFEDVMNRLHWFLPPRFAVLGVQRGVFEYGPL